MTAQQEFPPDGEEVRHTAVDAVAAVFDRLAAEFGDPAAPAGGAAPPRSEATGDPAVVQAAIGSAVRLLTDVVLGLVEGYSAIVEQGGEAGDAPLTLAGSPGRSARATVWLHNRTAEPVRGLALAVTPLSGFCGAVIDSSATALDPPAVDVEAEVPAQSTLTVRIPDSARPGAYHGHVLAADLDAALPLRLIVEPDR
jgi:hypothetical protein